MAKGSGGGWLRVKRSQMFFCWRNAASQERSKLLGSSSMSEAEAWIKLGELGLDKMVHQPDPARISFGELAEKYLRTYPFNKNSTKELHEQQGHAGGAGKNPATGTSTVRQERIAGPLRDQPEIARRSRGSGTGVLA